MFYFFSLNGIQTSNHCKRSGFAASWCLISKVTVFWAFFLMGRGVCIHVQRRGYLWRIVLFYNTLCWGSCSISGAYDAVYPSNSLKAACMSGPAKASSWQQTYGMCYVCLGFVCSKHARCGSVLRALRLFSINLKIDSDCYTGMTSSCPVYGLETHI